MIRKYIFMICMMAMAITSSHAQNSSANEHAQDNFISESVLPTQAQDADESTPSSAEANAEEGRSEITSVFMTSYSTANELKLISETTGWGKNHLGYAYVEVGTVGFKDRWLYTQLIWEQKFWTMPLYLHAEVRSYFTPDYDSFQCFGGLAYTIPVKCGSITLEPLYRYDTQAGHGGQLTIFGAYDWKRFSLTHYSDIYRCQRMDVPLTMYNECRSFYNINRRFEVGLIGILSYSFIDKFDALSLAAALKVNI